MIGIDPEYFLDEMSIDETQAIYKARNEHDKLEWEKIRTMCFYSYVAIQGTKNVKTPSDLFAFTWEKTFKNRGNRLTSDEAQVKASKMHIKKNHG